MAREDASSDGEHSVSSIESGHLEVLDLEAEAIRAIRAESSEESGAAAPQEEESPRAARSRAAEEAKRREEAEAREVQQSTGEELIEAARAGNLDLCKDVLAFAAEEGLAVLDCRTPGLPGSDPGVYWTDFSPLMAACRAGHAHIVEHLLPLGPALELFDRDYKMTALMWAAEADCTAILRLLKDKADHDARDSRGRTALMQASERGRASAVEALLWNSDVNAVDGSGRSALLLACLEGHVGVAKKLCDFDANVDQADKARRTPLLHAARWGKDDVVQLLLERGADPDKRDKRGWTAAMLAARWDKRQVLARLLDHGVDLAARDRSVGRNAFMWAVVGQRSVALVRLLEPFVEDFDLAVKDVYGKTAFDLADGMELEAALRDLFEAHGVPLGGGAAAETAGSEATTSEDDEEDAEKDLAE